MRFIWNFIFFGILFYLIWMFFPDAFNTLVGWANHVVAFFKDLIMGLWTKFQHTTPTASEAPSVPAHAAMLISRFFQHTERYLKTGVFSYAKIPGIEDLKLARIDLILNNLRSLIPGVLTRQKCQFLNDFGMPFRYKINGPVRIFHKKPHRTVITKAGVSGSILLFIYVAAHAFSHRHQHQHPSDHGEKMHDIMRQYDERHSKACKY